MSDDRELVERLAAIDATPRASWVAELRADLDAAWETGDVGCLDSLRTTTLTLVDHEPPLSEPSSGRRWPILIAAAAAVVVAIAVVATRNDDATPADQPSPTVFVPPSTPPRPLPDARAAFDHGGDLVPGTYFVDEVDGRPVPRIHLTVGSGWQGTKNEGIDKPGESGGAGDGAGGIGFSRPGSVFRDACHWGAPYQPNPETTLDGLVAALTEQEGWVDVTVSDIVVDGYVGKAFQRTTPAISDCDILYGYGPRIRPPAFTAGAPAFRGWLSADGATSGSVYGPGIVETLWVLDVGGTIVAIQAHLFPVSSTWDVALEGPSAEARAEFAAVLDSIRIDQPSPTVTVAPTTPPQALPNVSFGGPIAPGTYYVDEVDGIPTPRIFATIGTGWRDPCGQCEGWGIWKRVPHPDDGPFNENLQRDIGSMSFSHPDAVYSDACHWEVGNHPGPVDTVDGLVTALIEQKGWTDVTAPLGISIDGYVGKAFQRTAPADMSECTTRSYHTRTGGGLGPHPDFRSWEIRGEFNDQYEPGETETLWVIDLDGTMVVISTAATPEPSAGAPADFAADVLDSIRIERP